MLKNKNLTFGNRKMAEITITKVSDTIKENRWSAEFFEPKYLFEPKDEYKWARIGRILKQCQYGILISMNEDLLGYPIFRMNEIEDCFTTEAMKYAAITAKQFKQFELEVDDVLFNRTNSIDFVGRTGMYKGEIPSTFASYLVRVKTYKNYILPEFLTIYLNTKFGKGQIRRRAMHSINQANVSAAELKRILIPLIEIDKQQRIADLVNKAYNLKRQSKSLYTQAINLLENALGLDNIEFKKEKSYTATFSEIVSNNRTDADYYQTKYPQLASHLETISTVRLGSICNITKGFEVGSAAYTENGPLFIRVSNLSKDGFIQGNSDKYISESLYNSLKAYQPNIGDILLTKDGTIGTCYVVDEMVEGIISGGILNLALISPEIPKEYLALVINSKVCNMQANRDCSGALILHWKPEEIRKLKIPILASDLMGKLNELAIESKIARKESKQLLEQAKQEVEQLIEKAAQN
jgi:type I restriction enzyme, S subunit